MKMDKQAKIKESTIESFILVAILIVVLFKIVASIFPTLVSAGDSLNASGFPLGELFVSGGAIWYLMAGGIIFLVVKSFMGKSKK